MKARIRGLLVAVVLAGPASAAAVTINFNDGVANGAIGEYYSSLGVTFDNGRWGTPFANQAGTPSDGLFLGTVADDGGIVPFTPTVRTPIVLTFSSGVSALSILAVDVGVAGARMEAFDAAIGGSLLGTADLFGPGTGLGNFGSLSIEAAGIRRVHLYQPMPNGVDGVFFDNLVFTRERRTVTEPGSLALLGLGLAGLLVARRNKSS